jgi:hypothetical protein
MKYKEERPVLRNIGDELADLALESGLIDDFTLSEIVSLTETLAAPGWK